MRCLYCGKTLAFLKRLTGGGEFCSDAHRIKYQEEYNQLALSRLMQSGNEPSAALGRTLVPAEVSSVLDESPVREPEHFAAPEPEPKAEVVVVSASEPDPIVEEPAASPEIVSPEADAEGNDDAPPVAPYLLPSIALSALERIDAGNVEPATIRAGAVALPLGSDLAIESPLGSEIALAPRVGWHPHIEIRDAAHSLVIRSVEPREFSGSAELPQSALTPTPVHGVPVKEIELDTLAWGFAPRLASEARTVWHETPVAFAELAEAGASAGLGLNHSGYEELAEAAAREPALELPAPSEQLPLPAPSPAAALRIVGAPEHIEPSGLEPRRLERVHLTPARMEPTPPPTPSRVTRMPASVTPPPANRPPLHFAVNYGTAVPAAPETVHYPAAATDAHPAPAYVSPTAYLPGAPSSAPPTFPAALSLSAAPPLPATPSFPAGPSGQPVSSAPSTAYAPAPAPQVSHYWPTAPQGPMPVSSPPFSGPMVSGPPVSAPPSSVPPAPGPSAPPSAPVQSAPPPSLYVVPGPMPPPQPAPVVSAVSHSAPLAPVNYGAPPAVPVTSPQAPSLPWRGPSMAASPETSGPVRVVPPPKPETEPLPVTLHAMAAPAPNAMLARAEAMLPSADPQIPRPAALPLRPTMYFAAAPAGQQPVETAAKSDATPATPEMHDAGVHDAHRVKGKHHGKHKRADVKVTPPEPQPAAKAEPVAKEPAKPEAVRETKPEPKPEPKPELVKPSSEPKLPKPLAPPVTDVDLGLPTLHLTPAVESRWAKLPVAVKVGLAAAIVAAITGAAYLVMDGGSATAGQARVPEVSNAYDSGLPLAATNWVENWTKARTERAPRLDILPTSMQLSDYRIEFRSEILSKATGWVYRALNPRNYYAARVEMATPGAVPEMVLTRVAVIDGRTERLPGIKIPAEVEAGKINTVKFEALGGKFAVWVQDKKIAEWSDRRIGSGGVGIYTEPGDSALLRGVYRVTPLVAKN